MSELKNDYPCLIRGCHDMMTESEKKLSCENCGFSISLHYYEMIPRLDNQQPALNQENIPMSELKNKDGLPIIVGQVWEEKDSNNERRVLVFSSKEIPVTECLPDCQIAGWNNKDFPDVFHRLISCPRLGEDMGKYDIVTDEIKEKYWIPLESHFLTGEHWMVNQNERYDEWECDIIYRVPRGFDFEPYRKDNRCEHCGSGDDAHHSYSCPTGLHPDKREPTESAGKKVAPIEKVPYLPSGLGGYDLKAWRYTVQTHLDTLTIIINKHADAINELIEAHNKEQGR